MSSRAVPEGERAETEVDIDESEMRAKSAIACMDAADGLLKPDRAAAQDGYLAGKREQACQQLDLAFARGDADFVAKWLKVIDQLDGMMRAAR